MYEKLFAIFVILASSLMKLTKHDEQGALKDMLTDGPPFKFLKWPFVVKVTAFLDEDYFICAGVLIDKTWVMVPKHCGGEDASPATTYLLCLKNEDCTNQQWQTHGVIRHPDRDVALVPLVKGVHIDLYTHYAKMIQSANYEYFEGDCVVIGWGWDMHQANLADQMHYLNITKVHQCEDGSKNWCSIVSRKENAPCQGTSGGPLLCKDTVVGMTMATNLADCLGKGGMAAFTNIHLHWEWIKDIIDNPEMEEFSDNAAYIESCVLYTFLSGLFGLLINY